jgi:peptidoglycan/LPS O-acetylase OafA/YrhL
MNPVAVAQRLFQVDLLKALAAHLIVWHHLAFYGPMADHLLPVWPGLVAGLADHGRLAVTVFLVAGGYLAARSLAPDGQLRPDARVGALLLDRWWRLVAPFAVVLVAALLANLLADRWMDHPSVEVPADAVSWLARFGAHLLLLHDLLDAPALTAGAWYVAIDLQLYAVMLVLLATARWMQMRWPSRRPIQGPVLVALAGLVSVMVFNRDPRWDEVAPYFIGPYALGALVAWCAPVPSRRVWLLAAGAAVALALVVDWRMRLLVALVVAGLLALAVARAGARTGDRRSPAGLRDRLVTLVRVQSDHSYALFLVHFPVALVVNAAFTRWAPPTAWAQGLGLLVAWGLAIAVARGFHRQVEQPLQQAWRRRRRRAASPDPREDRSVLGA